jgi:hypothetical protein
MHLIQGIKRRLHRDIVADPVLHGRVLNLYLNGEQYPHRVAGYFPMAAVEDPALEQRMREHLREEDKHVALYTKAIRELGQPVTELPMDDIYNTVIRRHTPSPSSESLAATDGNRLELAHFLAHLHCLESRVAQSLEYHLDACAHAANPYPAKAVHAILADEHAHAGYTREALFALLPQGSARDVLRIHQRAESRANREFSARELRRLLVEEGGRFGAACRVLYAASAALMQGGTVHG